MTSNQPPTPPPGVPPQEPQWRAPASGPPPQGRGASFFVAVFLGLLLLVSGGLNVMLLLLSFGSIASAGLGGLDGGDLGYDLVRVGGAASAPHKVLRIPIHGAIAEAENPVLGASGGMVTEVRRALRYAENDDSVRGIWLSIDSPGGGVTDSDEIYRMLRRFKSNHPDVKVIALFGDIAASGGYYVACAADRIVARRSSITGSIGVIMSAWNFAKAAQELGIEQVAIKSERTPYKDMLSPTRPMTDAEREILTGIVDELYDQFVDVVDYGRRGLERDEVVQLANGAIYSAEQARQNRLIDAIGDPVSVEEEFAADGPVQIVEHRRRPSLRDLLFGAAADAPDLSTAAARLLTAATGPRFLFYWQGAR
ncbi:MAG: signal peptide peptidase SppA [Planctomycetota bacterium]